MPVHLSPPLCFLLPPRSSRCVLLVVLSGVPFPRLLVRHSTRSVQSTGSSQLPFMFSQGVHSVYVRSRTRSWSSLRPLVGLTRATHAVPVQDPDRAIPGGSCPSAFHALVPCSAFLAWGMGRPFLASPCLAPGRSPPRGWARVSGAGWRPGRSEAGRGEVRRAFRGGRGWPAACASPLGGVAVLRLGGGGGRG